MDLTNSKKFWVIWYSTLDKARTIPEIHDLWGYTESSRALYQPAGTGHEKSIAREMAEEGFLEIVNVIETQRGKPKVYEAKTDWLDRSFDSECVKSVDNVIEFFNGKTEAVGAMPYKFMEVKS